MSKQGYFSIGVVVVGLGALVVVSQPAFALDAPYATFKKTKLYQVAMVRAMDPCTPDPLNPSEVRNDFCPQSNSETAGLLVKFGDAKLAVKQAKQDDCANTGKCGATIKLTGHGFGATKDIIVWLKLRVTQLYPKAGTASVTYADFSIDCGPFTSKTNGNMAGTQNLSECLSNNLAVDGLGIGAWPAVDAGRQTGNIQILDSALKDSDTGKVLATPGILD